MRAEGLVPVALVCWTHVERVVCRYLDPTVQNATAWKDKRMCAVVVEHGELKFVIKTVQLISAAIPFAKDKVAVRPWL
jgi:hypothetical protein